MVYSSFDQLVEQVRKSSSMKKLLVVAAHANHALDAAIKAYDEKVAEPILIGDKGRIIECLHSLGEERKFDIIDIPDPEEAVQRAADMINAGEGDILLKGLVDTGILLKIMFKKENKMRISDVVSGVSFSKIETYHKILGMTDAIINPYPDINQKRAMIQNAVDAMTAMGWSCPKVGVLAAVEKVNPKMPETLEAAELKTMWQEGKIRNCIVEGPISLDLCIDPESAKEKRYDSPVAGDADLLLCPNIHAANIAVKMAFCTGHNVSASIVCGLKTPAVLSSRGASVGTKFRGILLGAGMCR